MDYLGHFIPVKSPLNSCCYYSGDTWLETTLDGKQFDLCSIHTQFMSKTRFEFHTSRPPLQQDFENRRARKIWCTIDWICETLEQTTENINIRGHIGFTTQIWTLYIRHRLMGSTAWWCIYVNANRQKTASAGLPMESTNLCRARLRQYLFEFPLACWEAFSLWPSLEGAYFRVRMDRNTVRWIINI